MTAQNVWLFQPAHHSIFQGEPSYWLPYSTGCIWSYAQQFPDIQQFFAPPEFVFQREPIKQLLTRIENPGMAVFSSYVWNFQYNLVAAQAIKKQYPQCLIVFGGPQVTARPFENRFFKKHPYVDCVVNGEGEQAFLDICRSLIDGKPIPKQVKGDRLKDLSYPSPYSGGVFDALIERHPDFYWQATIETNRGCPYQCTFCDWGSAINSKIHKFPEQRVLADIDWSSKNRVNYLFIADANFGIFYDRDRGFAERINQVQHERGFPKIVLAQWAKNSQARIIDIAKIFFNDRNRGFTLSVQSMNDTVLDAIKRKNMQVSDMAEMLRLCNENDISAYTELILPLPHETRDSWRENHWRLLEVGQHNNVDVWLATLLENSELNTVEQRQMHGIEAVSVSKFITGSVLDLENGEIPEQEWVIKSTKYMTTDDLIDSYIFSALINHYHYNTGATIILSRVLEKFNSVSFKDFYEHLEHSIIKKDTWLSGPYDRLEAFLRQYLSGQDPDDAELKFSSHAAMWLAGKTLLTDVDRMMRDLKAIFTREWCNLPADFYDQLWHFQDNYVIRWNRPYPIEHRYDFDFLGFIKGDKLEQPVINTFRYANKWNSIDSFLESAYYNRRTRQTVNADVVTEKIRERNRYEFECFSCRKS